MDELIVVRGYAKTGQDEKGFPVKGEPFEKEIFAAVRSAGVIEHYEAQKAGVKISCIFRVDTDSYKECIQLLNDGTRVKPSEVIYDGETFKIHTVRRKKDYKQTEIVCEEME